MKIQMLFLIPEGLRHQLMFICPNCGCQTFTPTTTNLTDLRCVHCGEINDARSADFEVLAPYPPPRSAAGRHLHEPPAAPPS